MNNYLLGIYEKAMPETLSLVEKLQTAKEYGFDFVELSIDESDVKLSRLTMPLEDRVSLAESMLREGIRFESICLSGHRKYPLGSNDPETQKRALDIMKKAILLAKDLGIRLIQIAGYDVYYEESSKETRALFSEGLSLSVEFAAKHGVMLAFETMETAFIDTVEKATKWVEQINSPYLQVYPDTGNITNAAKLYGTDVLSDLRSGSSHLAALHLKESLPGIYREVPYGTGHVDFSALIQTAKQMGVRRYLAEFWYTGQQDWKADLSFANRFLKDKLNQY